MLTKSLKSPDKCFEPTTLYEGQNCFSSQKCFLYLIWEVHLTTKEAIKNAIIYGISLFLTKRVRQMLCYEPYFEIWEEKGLHIAPVHYYQPIPDTKALSDNIRKNHSELIGVDMNVHKPITRECWSTSMIFFFQQNILRRLY